MKKQLSAHSILLAFLFTLLLLGGGGERAYGALNPANFTTNLEQLVIDGNNLLANMENVTLSSFTMAAQLSTLENSTQLYLESVGDVYKSVATSTDNTTMDLTDEMLIPLQTLSTITASLTHSLVALSRQMTLLSAVTSATTIEASLASMLRLSDDIGVMADRILEMADKILIMANNIGLMADRILATQIIQSDNLKVLVDASLETQKNILLMFSMLL
ncbi:MAG: hypothetical protein KJ804_12035 [Proteobacteria bacterium]|nr:hypothetical protein [Pseudomonadota bacterium]MBU1059032.1 hypothetical protein [Pseudomonadota bacterium]